jgi:hypothetical protein
MCVSLATLGTEACGRWAGRLFAGGTCGKDRADVCVARELTPFTQVSDNRVSS